MLTRIRGIFNSPQISDASSKSNAKFSTLLNELIRQAEDATRLQVANEHIAFGDEIQHLHVRDEELYQRTIRKLDKFAHLGWQTGILVPEFNHEQGRGDVLVYAKYKEAAFPVGRIRNSMTQPVFETLLQEFQENQRVIPVIIKTAPGRRRRDIGIIAYAKTDLLRFPTY